MSDVENTDILVGLGIYDDWSFEEQFSSNNDIPVLAYDASISKMLFLRLWFQSIIRFDRPMLFLRWAKAYFGYKKFFKNQKKHIQKFVAFDHGKDYICLNDVILAQGSSKIFLKIDIEGGEYRLLEKILTHQDLLTGLVIEFHDCDCHIDKILDFINQLRLNLIHIHANNSAPINSDNGLPVVMEMSFSRLAVLHDSPILPHPLDMRCDPTKEEVELIFETVP